MARYRRTHAEAWDYLLSELQPDVAFVQEALFDVGSNAAGSGRLIWSDDRGSDSGTGLFVRTGLDIEPFTVRAQGSYLAAGQLDLAGGPMLVVSVHVGPPNYKKHLRHLVEVLSATVAARRFLIGGDLNAARHIDEVYGSKWFAGFFEDLARRDFHDCHFKRHGCEVQSFWGRQARNPYQCDHFFADSVTDQSVISCEIVDNPEVRRLSDHGPIQLQTPPDVAIPVKQA